VQRGGGEGRLTAQDPGPAEKSNNPLKEHLKVTNRATRPPTRVGGPNNVRNRSLTCSGLPVSLNQCYHPAPTTPNISQEFRNTQNCTNGNPILHGQQLRRVRSVPMGTSSAVTHFIIIPAQIIISFVFVL
jgi:hypothetical protein